MAALVMLACGGGTEPTDKITASFIAGPRDDDGEFDEVEQVAPCAGIDRANLAMQDGDMTEARRILETRPSPEPEVVAYLFEDPEVRLPLAAQVCADLGFPIPSLD